MKHLSSTLALNKSSLSKEVIYYLYCALNVADFLNKIIFLNKSQSLST